MEENRELVEVSEEEQRPSALDTKFFAGTSIQVIIKAAIAVLIATLSFFPIGDVATSSETYFVVNETLDAQQGNVEALLATSVGSAAAISALPDDLGGPIADKLADLSGYILIILSVIFLEKVLLTTLGFLSFRILIPVACLLFLVALFMKKDSKMGFALKNLGLKLGVLGLALVLVVPSSVFASDMIYNNFEADQQLALQQQTEQESAYQGNENEQTGEGSTGDFFSDAIAAVQGAAESVTSGAQEIIDDAIASLNNLIEQVAVVVVTSCIIPILMLFLFLQLVKIITGSDVGGVLLGEIGRVQIASRGVRKEIVATVKRAKD